MPTYEANLSLREMYAPPEAEYGQFPVWMDYSISHVMQDIENNPKVVHALIPFFGSTLCFYSPRDFEFLDYPEWKYMGEQVTALDMEYYENINILTKWCHLDEKAAKYALEWIFQWGSVSEFLDYYGEIEQIQEDEITEYEENDFSIFQDAAFSGAIAIR